MSMFGLVFKQKGESDEYYTSEDANLRQWLLSTDYESSHEQHGIKVVYVKLPIGYVFYNGNMVKEDSEEITDSSDIQETVKLPFHSIQIWKAKCMMDSLTPRAKEEFEALNVLDDDIFSINEEDILGHSGTSISQLLMIITGIGAFGAALAGALFWIMG